MADQLPPRRTKPDEVRTAAYHQRLAVRAVTGAFINAVIFVATMLLLLAAWLCSWNRIALFVIAGFALLAGVAAVVEWLKMRRQINLAAEVAAHGAREPPSTQL